MKKRFLNALILGAVLLSTGAVTSCKDYDDDINNLQSQIDKLSQLESLKTDVATLQSAVSAAQSDATKALADAKAAADKADKAATAEQLKELQKALDAANELIVKKADKTEVKDLQEQLDALKKLVEEYKGDNATLSAAVAAQVKDLLEKSTLAADVTDLESRVEALEEKANQGGGDAEDLNTLIAAYNALKAQAEELGIAVSSMITSVELFGTVHENAHPNVSPCDHTISFTTIAELDNTFTAPDGTKIEFKKGNWATYGDSVVVRVTPTNANLTKEMVSLINSQGAVLDDVEIESVERFNTKLTATRAAVQNTGLWTIKFNLAKDYDSEAFEKATIVKKNQNSIRVEKVLFAVAIDAKLDAKVAKDENASRSVVSEFDLDMSVNDGVLAKDFCVNDKGIANIRNRFHYSENKTSTWNIEDYTWAPSTTRYPTPATAIDKDKNNVRTKNMQCEIAEVDGREDFVHPYTYDGDVLVADCRQTKDLLAVEVGTPITIDYSYINDEYFNKNQKVAGFYVTLDESHAVESGVSEINAWKGYTIDGLGTMLGVDAKGNPTNKGEITVQNLGNVKGDIIGFRVYAVNLDGTLLDPDGRAFYVAVGGVVTDGNVASTTLDIKIDGKTNKSEIIELATDVNVGKYMSNWVPSDENPKIDGVNTPAFTVTFYKDAAGKNSTTDRSQAKYVQFSIANGNEKLFIDGETYTQTATLFDKADDNETVLLAKTITATMTKVMPTDVPTYSFRPGQQLDANNNPTVDEAYKTGKFRAYLTPNNGYVVSTDPSESGYVNMNNILYDNLANGYSFNNLKFNFINAGYKADGKTKQDLTVKGTNKVNVPVANIDDKTEYTVEVSYVYAGISTKKNDKGEWEKGQDYAVKSPNNLTAIFSCWHYASTFEWGTYTVKENNKDVTKSRKPSLTWSHTGGTDVAETKFEYVSHKNTYDNEYFGKDLAVILFDKKFLGVETEAHLKSADGQVDPYFNVTIDPATKSIYFNQSQTTNAPGIDHEETLEIVVKDAFKNHKTTIKLPVTIKKP